MENSSLYELAPIIDKYRNKDGNLIPVLNEVQNKLGYLPEDAQEYIAKELKIPLSEVYGVVTFYAQFSMEPKGEYVIHVCDGTACHVRKSQAILEAIKDSINIEEGKTSPDRLFTLETVSCLGACGLAPVVTINEKVYGKMSPKKINKVLTRLKEGKAVDQNES